MSQRNRIVLTALALVAAITLATPNPARAAGLRIGRLPAADALERAWSWMARLVTGPARTPVTMQEKEGGMINPDGSPHHLVGPTLLPLPPGSDGGK